MKEPKLTEFAAQARIFAKRITASKWAKLCNGTVIPIPGLGYIVTVDGKGCIKGPPYA